MKWWVRLLITLLFMLVVSYFFGRLWFTVFGVPIPAYLAGVVGGLAAIPVWEFMRWISTKYP